MTRHRLFTAIVLSGLATTRCGGEIAPADASAEDDATRDARSDGASLVFQDAPYEAPPPDAEAPDVVDAFVMPPIITH